MQTASPEALPLIGLSAVLLWNLAEDGQTAAHCVDACITLHHALGDYGIESRVEAIALRIEKSRSHALYGGLQGPTSDAYGNFNGHAVLVVPGAGRFVDPTVQQFPAIPDTERDMVPVVARLPYTDSMGDEPIPIHRGDYRVVYLPLPAQQRKAWRNPINAARAADYRNAGANLAANVFALMRLEEMGAKPEQWPYPRLRTLVTALDGTELVADDDGDLWFAHPATGTRQRLADVP